MGVMSFLISREQRSRPPIRSEDRMRINQDRESETLIVAPIKLKHFEAMLIAGQAVCS